MIGAVMAAGAVMGWAGSVAPSGPVSATAYRQGLAGVYRSGLAVAGGGAVAKGVYAGLAAWGTGELVGESALVELIALLLGALVLGVLGVGLLRRGLVPVETRAGWRPGWGSGFIITLVNPTVLATFSLVAGLLRAWGLPLEGGLRAALFGLGTSIGMFLWFVALMALMHRFRDAFGERGRLVLSRVMGVLLCALALACALGAALR